MPIPLGILAAAGVRAAGGSYELIETITVGSGGAASVTFSNLNTYSSTYQHLQIRGVTRSQTTTQDFLVLKHNGNSVNARHVLYGNGQGVFSLGSSGSTDLGGIPKSNDTTNAFGFAVIDILDAYEAKNKTIRGFTGSVVASSSINLVSALRVDTAATSSIELATFNSTGFAQYSRFSIYGLKAS